jgi:hypothetical protein
VRAVAPELAGEPPSAFEPAPAADALLQPDLGASGVIGDPRAADAAVGTAFIGEAASALAALAALADAAGPP